MILAALAAVPLAVAAVTDGRRRIIPDTASMLLAALGLLSARLDGRLASAVACGLFIGAGLLVLRHIHDRLTGEPGLGLGDVKLIAAGAVWLEPAWAGGWIAATGVAGMAWALARRQAGVPLAVFAAPILGILILVRSVSWPTA